MVENVLPEIDCDANNGVTIHSGFWQVVYTTGIHGGIIREILEIFRAPKIFHGFNI